MSYIDFILNLVGLLLWINWRSLGLLTPVSALSLAANLKPASRSSGTRRWIFLALLPVLLALRALFYWYMGGPLEWTPKLSLGVQVIPFRPESLGHDFLFSLLSFGLTLVVFQLWMLLLSAINWRVVTPDPVTRLARAHLGRMGRWPMGLQLALPFLLAAALWPLLSMLFTRMQIMPEVASPWQLAVESLGLGLAVLLSWKYLLLGLLALYLAHSYIYFGTSPFWQFIDLSGKNLLGPLRWLRLGRLDFAPLFGMVLVLVVCEGIERWPQWLLPKPEIPGAHVGMVVPPAQAPVIRLSGPLPRLALR